ncbi:MAG: hypothetical protein ABIG96_06045 [Candidatus Micrarchaeota archaeon]
MPISPEVQRRQMVSQQPPSSKAIAKQKIRENMAVLRIASGANSVQGFGKMTIGAIVLSIVFSFATLAAVLYNNFFGAIGEGVGIVYPIIGGFILVLFYEAVQYLREGFLLFEQSKSQEDAALEQFAEKMLE